MNIFDLTLTYIGLKQGYISEGNILLSYLYNKNELYFIFLKSIVIIYFSIALLRLMKKTTKIITILLWIAFVVYSYITIIHVIIILFYK